MSMAKFDGSDLVSIITPAYNSEKYIASTLESVIQQTYKNWELLIIDDCSIDSTAKIVQSYMEKDKRIRYYKLDKNSGAAIARNKAIEHAKGKYLAFLDSDDIWFPDKLRKQINYMKKYDYNFTCTSYTKIDEQGNYLNHIVEANIKSNYDGLLKKCPGNSTVIYNAGRLGKFKIPDIKKRNDYVMWLQVIKKENYLYGIEEPLSSHRVRPNSISSNKINLLSYHWKVYREIEQLSFFKSIYLIFYWTIVSGLKLR